MVKKVAIEPTKGDSVTVSRDVCPTYAHWLHEVGQLGREKDADRRLSTAKAFMELYYRGTRKSPKSCLAEPQSGFDPHAALFGSDDDDDRETAADKLTQFKRDVGVYWGTLVDTCTVYGASNAFGPHDPEKIRRALDFVSERNLI